MEKEEFKKLLKEVLKENIKIEDKSICGLGCDNQIFKYEVKFDNQILFTIDLGTPCAPYFDFDIYPEEEN